MKSTGIVRPVDSLGRVVLPKELRTALGIVEKKDAMEIFVKDEYIMLKKYQPACIFCDSMDGLKNFDGKVICKDCVERMKKL